MSSNQDSRWRFKRSISVTYGYITNVQNRYQSSARHPCVRGQNFDRIDPLIHTIIAAKPCVNTRHPVNCGERSQSNREQSCIVPRAPSITTATGDLLQDAIRIMGRPCRCAHWQPFVKLSGFCSSVRPTFLLDVVHGPQIAIAAWLNGPDM